MTKFWDWFARLAGITIAVLSLRAVLVERELSLQVPMPKAVERVASDAERRFRSVTNKRNGCGSQIDRAWSRGAARRSLG